MALRRHYDAAMAVNIALKVAFMESRKTQNQVAYKIRMTPTRLSQIAHGWVRPTESEKRRIAQELGKPVDEIFPEAVA